MRLRAPKIAIFRRKTTTFSVFLIKTSKSDGYSPLFQFLSKKTEKVVVFRLNMAIFGALNRMFTLNLEVTSEWTGRSKRGHSVSGQYVTYLGVTSFVGHILIENPDLTAN